MSTKTRVNYYPSDQELVLELGKKILINLYSGIKDKGRASLVVSGGSTPKGLFRYLSVQEFPWDKVSFILADDRCVDVHQSKSNYFFLKEYLFQNNAAEAKFIPLYCDEDNAEQAAANACKRIKHFKQYDMVILGMGTDGHTASLFPQAENLAMALSDESPDCIAIDPVTNNMMRVTQSLKKLLKTRAIAFHLVGPEKQDILHKVLQDKDKKLYPSSYVIHQDKTPVEIFVASK
jgi:6-phosphogluconolactonase